MTFRSVTFLVLLGLALSACNFTLAADVTPPPDYVPPTPLSTLGPLFPARAPDVQKGAALYTEHCLPCHGETGLGDGPTGKQLPVTVAALGLPDIARKASPARWFTVVSQGNLDRFMPPFTSLSDQQRWDVVAYALSLHVTADQLAQGKALFESNCAGCSTAFFSNQENMAALSEDDLVQLIKNGGTVVPAFGVNLSAEGLYAVAAYLRTLSLAAPVVDTATGPPIAAEATPAKGTAQADVIPVASEGLVSGSLQRASGASVPAGLIIKLRGFDHAQDTSGPQEILTLEGSVLSDGTFTFENVPLPEGRILLAEVTYDGITYQSEFAVAGVDSQSIALAPITIYESSDDLGGLTFQQIHLAFDFGAADSVQIFEIYTFLNATDHAITIETDGTHMPFIALPEGAQDVGFEAGQTTNQFVAAEGGFAVLPSREPYSLIAFFTLPYNAQRTEIIQTFAVPADSALVFVPEGVKLQSNDFAQSGVQQISNTNFQTYSTDHVRAGATLTFALSGRPREEGSISIFNPNQALVFGAGALGLTLIVLALWMYARDRNQPRELDDGSGDGFEHPEDIMDAILALDDLHRAGKIPPEAYQARRAELKEMLRSRK
jgi:mono/diheme cytochrome c family protein